MKFITLALIATVMIAGAYAATDAAGMQTCVSNAGSVCGSSSSSTCYSDLSTQSTCMANKCATLTDMSEYANCISQTCRSSNGAISSYYDKLAACINGSILSLSVLLMFVLALLF